MIRQHELVDARGTGRHIVKHMPNAPRFALPTVAPALRWYALVAITVGISLMLLACGTNETSSFGSNSGGPSIFATDKILSIDQLTSSGFKLSKTFDTEGLPGAINAYYGFWGATPDDRREFEARFYASHDDAVAQGTALAEERTGKDAKLKSDQATWTEGLKEARLCTRAAGGDSSNCRTSKYGGYAIYGNLVLICQGRSASDSREACDALLDAVRGASET